MNQAIPGSWVQSLSYYQVQALKVVIDWGFLVFVWVFFCLVYLQDSAIEKYHRNVYRMQPMQAYSSQSFKY